jgi:eukaryotic-like serine/threonine-protein kinase
MEHSVAERLDSPPVAESGAVVAPGDLVAGRYKVRREITRGGMSAIVEARDVRLGRLVALKILLPRYRRAERVVDCFVAEAQMLARISNRHVVTVFDQGTISDRSGEAGLPFLVLELLRGENLRNYAVGHWPLELARVARFGIQVCEGVAAIHAQGIVHQDLKPDNLFVTREPDGTECVKVLDLGIALRPGMPPGVGTQGAGSPGYMSPEQVSEPGAVDARSDIWSLGAVLYELFAGRAPFEPKDMRDFCSRIVGDETARLAEARPDLPMGISLAVERCLESDRRQRFQNVAELASCLAPYADQEPIDDAERIRRWLETPSRVPSLLQGGLSRHFQGAPRCASAPFPSSSVF